MAKTVDDLIASREGRERVLDEFNGELPTSILRYNSSIRSMDLIVENERSYENTADDGGHAGKLGKAFSVSGRTCRGEGAGLSHDERLR